ncbi:MAG: PepSY domain-containing protein [Thermoanaerobaculia bacterium]
MTATDARNRALVIFPGATITDVDLNDTERSLTVAEVKLLPAGGGGEVKLHFSLANGRLAEAESGVPPFTYSFAPGGEFISLAQAIAAATGSSGKAGTVTEWKLQLEGTSQWQYRIWVTAADGAWRIRVDARSGVVNRIQDR